VALILVVEDEAHVAELIADTLIERGHEARLAVSASHAATIVGTDRPDLILLDINLPDSAGTLALRRLRQLRPDVPVILVTASADDELARATTGNDSDRFNLDSIAAIVRDDDHRGVNMTLTAAALNAVNRIRCSRVA
jgi:CheY-like chemotaxis protein